MSTAPLRYLTFLSAVAGTAGVALLTVAGGAAFPGYSHSAQFISELGARGAPHEMAVRFWGFLPAGLLLLAFTVGAWMLLPRTRQTTLGLAGLALYVAGYIGSAFFPCDPGCRGPDPSLSQIIHNTFVIGYFTGAWALWSLGGEAKAWPEGGHLTLIGRLGSVLSVVGLLGLAPSSPYVGLSQRLIEAAVLAWVVACAWYLLRRREVGVAGGGPP